MMQLPALAVPPSADGDVRKEPTSAGAPLCLVPFSPSPSPSSSLSSSSSLSLSRRDSGAMAPGDDSIAVTRRVHSLPGVEGGTTVDSEGRVEPTCGSSADAVETGVPAKQAGGVVELSCRGRPPSRRSR